MSKYLIIGANSQLGINLFAHLNSQTPTPEIWQTSRKFNNSDKNKQLYLDLKHPSLADYHYNYAFFCAGISSIATCEQKPLQTKRYNFVNTVKLTQALTEAGCKVIFPSSNLIFNGNQPLYQIHHQPDPVTRYGHYKMLAESGIINASKNNLIVRFSKILPCDFQLFKDWITQLKLGKPISAFYNLTIAPVTMKFACQQLLQLTNINASGIWHISAKEDISYYNIALYLAECLKVSSKLVHPENAHKKMAFVPDYSSLDASKTDTQLQSKTPDSWQAIKQTLGLIL